MNEQRAEEAGYSFHGTYKRSFEKDQVVAKAKALRKEGNKAITVKVPDSKYSRGPIGCGYAVYWIESESNIAVRLEEERRSKNLAIGRRIDILRTEIADLEKELQPA